MRKGLLAGATVVVLAGPVGAESAAAAESGPTWNCRASVVELFGATAEPRFEPLVANGDGTTGGDRPTCANDREGAPVLAAPDGAPFTGSIQGPYSVTALSPAPGAARDQAAYAGARANEISFATPDGQLTFSATALRAEAAVHCVDGAPVFGGSSTVSDLRVNDVPLPLDDSTVGQITSELNDSPFGGVVKVLVNQKTQTADALTVQALRIELFDAAGAPQGVAVLGEAKVARQGDTCAAAAPPPSDTIGANGANGTNGSNGANGADGSNTTTTSTSPGTTGSTTTVVKKVVINGSNGGCGIVHAWFEKVDLLHRLPGRPAKATSRFGNRVMVRGQVLACKSHKPVVGARLDQIHLVGGGVGRLLKTGIRTRARGRFTYIEPLNLTTRRIVIAYRGNLASSKVTSRKTLRLTVRGKRNQIIRGRPPRTLE